MSTFCAYENYLRDRYVLGQSVHYAAGSSSPKPKSYDREGNEYVWSDEAGDYVRQVGGPGGGRTIRLSEVEKAEIEQPQNEQVNADSGQHDSKKEAMPQSNVDYAEFADAYKRYRAENKKQESQDERPQTVQKTEPSAQPKETEVRKPSQKKMPETKSGLDLEPIDDAGIEETVESLFEEHRPELAGKKRTFFPGLIEVDSYQLGYNTNPYHTMVDIDTICRSLMRDDVAFFEGDPDLMGFYDDPKDKIVLESWDGGKRRFTPRELYEFINEKYIEQYGEEADYHPIETSLSDLSFDLPLGKQGVSPARYAPAFRTGKKSDFERDVAYAVRDLSDLDQWLADPTEEIPRDLYRPLYDCAIRISKSAPPYYAEDKYKKEYLARDASLRNALGLAIFIPNSNDRLAKTKANELAKEFIGAALSETPNKGLAALRKKAKRLGFAISSDVPDKWDVFQADVEYTTPQSAQEPEPKDVIARDTETTAPDTAESETTTLERAPFDDSGLGLPGKSDVALKPDVVENKDAAYFVRRDLEATPKSETEETVEEVDEVSEAPSSESPQRDDDATLERKVKEALGKGEPLRKKATRLRSKAKAAALKGRKDEASELRKQADEIEAEARKYIDEATNAGVELKNRRAEASQQPVPETKEPIKKPEVPNTSVPEQQPEPVAETVQEQPRPERWTPLKSKMNDDDKRVVKNTRKRINYGLSELAWRLGNAKEKGDVQRVKQLIATAANHYLEQARRAYRSHGGTEALAAFDEALGGDGLTVGQLRDRVVDKFRKIAQMEANDLFKFAGERLDEFESFAEADREPIANKEIHLNSIRDKNGKWENLNDKDSEVAVGDGKPSTLFPDEYFGRRMGSERGLADAVRRALKSMTRKGEYRDSFENGVEYADPKYNIDTPTRMGRFLAHGYKDSIDGKPVSRDDYSEQRYQELLEKFPTDRESRKLNDLFKSNNREVNKLIKENEDEYKQSKNKSEVVQRVIDGIRDVLLERRQNGSAEAPPSESLRDGATGEVLETGGADRPSDGGDGRNLASVTPTSTPGGKTFNDTLGRIHDLAKSYSPSLGRMVARRVLEKKRHKKADLTTAIDVEYTEKPPRDIEQKFQAYKEAHESFDRVNNNVSVDTETRKKARETYYKTRDAFLDSVDEYADSVIQRFQEQSLNRQNKNVPKVIAEEAKKSDIPGSRVREELDASRQSETSTPQEKEKPDWLVALESQEDLKPVSRGEYNPNAKPYSWKAKFPETEDELREYWREHVDGGEDEEVSFGSDGERVSVGEQSGDAPMTPDELRRFAQLRHGRELRKSLGLSEHFSEKELKELQEPSEKRGRGRPSKKNCRS